MDLPTGPDGDAILRDIENTGAVLVRPYLDSAASVGKVEPKKPWVITLPHCAKPSAST